MEENEQASLYEERRRDYEIAFVFSASESEEERNAFLGRIRTIIADNGGELAEVSLPRTYTLAYPIGHERQGILVTLVMRASSTVPARINEAVRHEQAVLRNVIFGRPKARKPHARRTTITPRAEPQTPVSEEERTAHMQRMEEQIEAALTEGIKDKPR